MISQLCNVSCVVFGSAMGYAAFCLWAEKKWLKMTATGHFSEHTKTDSEDSLEQETKYLTDKGTKGKDPNLLKIIVLMASYLWRKYADYVYTKWERTILWDMVDPYRRPKSFKPLVTIYIAAFYTGVIGSAITEQLHKEKYWEDHPGEAVPLMQPKFYYGPWRIIRGEALKPNP
ncbi:hypothetical protein CMV_018495 [Castanea mollissima]|uniref:Uncharacterized protein n=1 Tax=Castanea mollissima TaxID=60419 RepID=A0A8J4VCI8_9ROSI|nr:hypothetical protein CMV_018495 [Castanea mollissima]